MRRPLRRCLALLAVPLALLPARAAHADAPLSPADAELRALMLDPFEPGAVEVTMGPDPLFTSGHVDLAEQARLNGGWMADWAKDDLVSSYQRVWTLPDGGRAIEMMMQFRSEATARSIVLSVRKDDGAKGNAIDVGGIPRAFGIAIRSADGSPVVEEIAFSVGPRAVTIARAHGTSEPSSPSSTIDAAVRQHDRLGLSVEATRTVTNLGHRTGTWIGKALIVLVAALLVRTIARAWRRKRDRSAVRVSRASYGGGDGPFVAQAAWPTRPVRAMAAAPGSPLPPPTAPGASPSVPDRASPRVEPEPW